MRPDIVLLFVLVLVPANIASMALYTVVGNWGALKKLTLALYMSGGLMSVVLGGMLGPLFSAPMPCIYPDNMGFYATRAWALATRRSTCGIFFVRPAWACVNLICCWRRC